LIRVYLSGDPVHDRVLQAFFDGCQGEKELVEGFRYEPSEVAVIFGVYKSKVRKSWPRGKVFRQQREKNLDVVVLETGYINRGDGEAHHYAAGFNGLNGRADFRNKNMGPERWESFGVQLKPYSRGEKVVLCGQVPWDASVDHTDHKAWIVETAQKLKAMTTRTIVFRPHPLAISHLPAITGLEYSIAPLSEDLKNAHCVVTFNSNSAVEALVEGKTVFAFDEGSMCWELANKNLADLENLNYPNRQQWARDLAYCQWTPDEMRQGLAWKHLFR
jgi:hypothetical protein